MTQEIMNDVYPTHLYNDAIKIIDEIFPISPGSALKEKIKTNKALFPSIRKYTKKEHIEARLIKNLELQRKAKSDKMKTRYRNERTALLGKRLALEMTHGGCVTSLPWQILSGHDYIFNSFRRSKTEETKKKLEDMEISTIATYMIAGEWLIKETKKKKTETPNLNCDHNNNNNN
jgi:hypothetical protein